MCSSTTSSPALCRRVGVDAEGRHAERLPDRLPDERPEDGDAVDLVEPERLHAASSRSASSTTGSISASPSTRSSRFATPAQLLERVVAELREPRRDLVAELPFERQPVLARRHAEEPVVQSVDPPQLVDRALVVVDAEVDGDVGELGVAAAAPRRRAAPPTAGRGGRRPRSARPRGTRAAARRGSGRPSPRTSLRARRPSPLPTRMFPCAAYPAPVRCPAQSRHSEPVYEAEAP